MFLRSQVDGDFFKTMLVDTIFIFFLNVGGKTIKYSYKNISLKVFYAKSIFTVTLLIYYTFNLHVLFVIKIL